MPNWGKVLEEIQSGNTLDDTRRKYLKIMNEYTGRNVIAYYSGFLQRQQGNINIDDNDKNAFMQTINGLDKSKGLDLILHTQGGDIAATESIVKYLHSIFGTNIRAFIPQMAMSAGTMIALSCKEIILGKQSNIGPIDPQFGGISCAGVLEEFREAKREVTRNTKIVPIWQSIISKYRPAFIGDCEKAIKWSDKMVKNWLCSNMLSENINPEKDAKKILKTLSSHSKTFNHSRHIHYDECLELGIRVKLLESFDKKNIENCKDLQDCVLTIHHAYMHTFSNSIALKIVENHMGNAMIISATV